MGVSEDPDEEEEEREDLTKQEVVVAGEWAEVQDQVPTLWKEDWVVQELGSKEDREQDHHKAVPEDKLIMEGATG